MSFEYKTRVRIDTAILEKVIAECKAEFDAVPVNKDSSEWRSLRSRWNNMQKFYERVQSGEIQTKDNIFEVVGSAKGGTARLYFKPSVTSLAKPFRKCIVPINPDNVFVFFDIVAAEFALNAFYAQEVGACQAYQRGEDIYMYYKDIFPADTPRKTIKTILIANMYGQTAYACANMLGITETQAQHLLDTVAQKLVNMTKLKRAIIAYDQAHHGYYAPNGMNQRDLVKVADIDPVKGFNPNFALSAYTQSGLGFFMQQFTAKLKPLISGTLLSVFDSVLAEMKLESVERYKDYVTKCWSPLRPDEFIVGKTFWQAAGYDKE